MEGVKMDPYQGTALSWQERPKLNPGEFHPHHRVQRPTHGSAAVMRGSAASTAASPNSMYRRPSDQRRRPARTTSSKLTSIRIVATVALSNEILLCIISIDRVIVCNMVGTRPPASRASG